MNSEQVLATVMMRPSYGEGAAGNSYRNVEGVDSKHENTNV